MLCASAAPTSFHRCCSRRAACASAAPGAAAAASLYSHAAASSLAGGGSVSASASSAAFCAAPLARTRSARSTRAVVACSVGPVLEASSSSASLTMRTLRLPKAIMPLGPNETPCESASGIGPRPSVSCARARRCEYDSSIVGVLAARARRPGGRPREARFCHVASSRHLQEPRSHRCCPEPRRCCCCCAPAPPRSSRLRRRCAAGLRSARRPRRTASL